LGLLWRVPAGVGVRPAGNAAAGVGWGGEESWEQLELPLGYLRGRMCMYACRVSDTVPYVSYLTDYGPSRIVVPRGSLRIVR
jgi:hypothetical protein